MKGGVVIGYIEFRFNRYGSAKLFRAACKRRMVIGKQRYEVVLVPAEDVEYVRRLAGRYGVCAIGGVPS
jgi:hypothetical protein